MRRARRRHAGAPPWHGAARARQVAADEIEGDSDPHEFIPALLQLHARGELPVEKLIRTYRFAEFARAMADAESGATIKPLQVFD